MRTAALAAFLCWLGPLAPAALAAAGQFQFVAGEVRVVLDDGRELAPDRGYEVNEGDTVVTGPGASAQLRMADEGIIAVRPDSRVKIEAYRWQGNADGTEKGVFALIKGGFRTLTGLIGRANKRAYLVRTPTATIGIRGTDHEPYFIPAEGWSGAPGAEPGSYDKVNAGATYLETAGGRLDLDPNQVGYAALDPQALPVRLPVMPEFMRSGPGAQGKDRRSSDKAAQERRREAAEGRRQEERRALALPIDERPLRPLQTLEGQTNLAQAVANLQPAPLGSGIVGGDLSANGAMGSGAGLVKPDDTTLLLDGAGNPALIRHDDHAFQYLRGQAGLVDHGTAIIMDNGTAVPVRWGIYAGGVIADAQGTRAVRYFHFAAAPVTPTAAPVNMSYTTVAGATAPITDTGALGGSVSSIYIQLNGGAQLVKYDLTLTDALGRAWRAHLAEPVSLAQFAAGAGGAPLAGECTGGTCGQLPLASGAPGSYAVGLPIGPTGQGMLSSYTLHTVTGGHGVTGSLVARP